MRKTTLRDRFALTGGARSIRSAVLKNSFPQKDDRTMAKAYFQPMMDIRARGTMWLPGLADNGILEGARRNRLLVLYAHSLGFHDFKISVSMRNKRIPDGTSVELPELPKSDDVNGDDPDEFHRMASKLVKPPEPMTPRSRSG